MRLFIKLDVDFQDDDKLLGVSAEAELLYIRSVAIAKRLGTDGGVTRTHLRRLTDKLSTDPDDLTRELVDADLWEPHSRGWVIVAYLKHNAAMDVVDSTREVKSAGGRLGNHRRWHSDDPKPDRCEHCRDELAASVGIGTESESDRSPIADRSPETETETETEKPTHTRAPARGKRPLPADWEPNDTHHRIATELDRDLTREATDFRDDATAHDRRYKDWHAAFRKWLRNEKYRTPTRASPNGQRPYLTAGEQKRVRALQAIQQSTGDAHA